MILTHEQAMAMIVGTIAQEELQEQVFAAICERGNLSLEYVEHKVAEMRQYEEQSNYGAW